MASPGDNKDNVGTCGHIMAAFDTHKKCARCKDKHIGQDACVLNQPCAICDSFSELQREMLLTPSYVSQKRRKQEC